MNSLNSTVEYDTARNNMWIELLGSAYRLAGRNKKKNMKLKFCDNYGVSPREITQYTYKQYLPQNRPLGDILRTTNIPDQRKENTMTKCAPIAYANASLTKSDPVETQRTYLLDRLRDVNYAKERALSKQFFLTVDQPETLKDFLDRIKNGQYTLPDNIYNDKDNRYWNVIDFFYLVDWRLPDQKADQTGYKKAKNVLDEQKTKVKDTIMIADPADGLKALQEFENWTYTA